MEQFSLEKYLENPSRKVVTRSGHNVRILCTDQRGNMPIVALVEFETLDGVQLFYHDGKNESHREYDLFFADEEEKPQSIEIPFDAFDSEFIRDEYLIPEGCKARIEGDKVIIEKIQKEEPSSIEELLSIITLQEIEYWRTHDKILKQDFNERAKQVLNLARKELLKDLPKWKKAKKDEELDCHVAIQQNDRVVLSDFVQKDEYYITLDVLKKLPKEE